MAPTGTLPSCFLSCRWPPPSYTELLSWFTLKRVSLVPKPWNPVRWWCTIKSSLHSFGLRATLLGQPLSSCQHPSMPYLFAIHAHWIVTRQSIDSIGKNVLICWVFMERVSFILFKTIVSHLFLLQNYRLQFRWLFFLLTIAFESFFLLA